MARSRCTRSMEPESSRSGAPISLRGPLDSSSGSVGFLQRSLRQRFLAQLHQDHVHRQAMQPGGKRRLSPERRQSCETTARRRPESGPPPRPYFRPCADTTHRPAGYEAGRFAQRRQRRPVGRGVWPQPLSFRWYSVRLVRVTVPVGTHPQFGMRPLLLELHATVVDCAGSSLDFILRKAAEPR